LPDLDTLAGGVPRPALRREYHPVCERPLQYIGFSFGGPRSELEAMRATGANAVGGGGMWNPTQDPDAPYGCGVSPAPVGNGRAAQVFTAVAPFDGVAPVLPTGTTTDSGCSWTLYRVDDVGRQEVATGVWPLVEDNSSPEAGFDRQPPGRYAFEIHSPTGSWMGWWVSPGNPYPDGHFEVAGRVDADSDGQFRLREAGEWRIVVAGAEGHRAAHIGPSRLAVIEGLGMFEAHSVGNWNNPGFNYYPEWFMDRFPEAATLDQHGLPVMGGSMFERELPSPGIESPVIVDGTQRFIRSRVQAFRESPALTYWVMGGEDLYHTYSDPSRWTDYSDNAIAHFREWLRVFRYDDSILALNDAWDDQYTAFDQVDPPREPATDQRWLDWLDFRFASMGERFGWHYRTIRDEDPDRLIMTCNHGTVYHGPKYAGMGSRYEIFAAQSDGFETGQIMSDSDPDFYNLLYTQSLIGLGKPYCPVRLAYKKSDPKARGGGTSYTPEAVRRYGYETLGAGAWHLGFIQWSGSLPDGEWGMVGTPGEQAAAEFHREIRELWPELDGMYAVHPGVGLLVSHPTWALDGWQDGWHAFHKAAIREHVPAYFVYDNQITGGQIDGDYHTLVSLDNARIDPQVMVGLERFVTGGGRLIVAGAFPEHDPVGVRLLLHEGTTRLKTGDAREVLARMDDECRPLVLSSRTRTTLPVGEEFAVAVHDWPQDVTEAVTLGQSCTLSRDGLHQIAIRMPTYHQVPPAGCTVNVRLDGPGGQIIGQKRIEAGAGDNAWHEVDVDAVVPQGARVYIEVEADPGFPARHLGWWSTRTDACPVGTAFEDGVPVQGDRSLRLTYHEPVPAEQSVEVFLLSDGAAFAAVLVNLAPEAVELGVDLSRVAVPGLAYNVDCPLDPDDWQGLDSSRGRLRIPAQDARVLFLRPAVTRGQARAVARAATERVIGWREQAASTPYTEHLVRVMAEDLDRARWAKVLARALQVHAGLGLRVAAPEQITASGPDSMSVWVLGSDAVPLDTAVVTAELTPTPGAVLPLTRVGPGEYRLTGLRTVVPPIYDYETRRYRPFTGPLRIRIRAVADGREASMLVDTSLVDPAR
jgi:hypothetical protein